MSELNENVVNDQDVEIIEVEAPTSKGEVVKDFIVDNKVPFIIGGAVAVTGVATVLGIRAHKVKKYKNTECISIQSIVNALSSNIQLGVIDSEVAPIIIDRVKELIILRKKAKSMKKVKKYNEEILQLVSNSFSTKDVISSIITEPKKKKGKLPAPAEFLFDDDDDDDDYDEFDV